MEWTPARIRLLREVGLCQSQHDFAKTLGVAKRTIGNAERSTHPPSLALRRTLDQALERASDVQRERFQAAVAAQEQEPAPVTNGTSPVVESLELLRQTEASELGPGTLEQMQELVDRLGVDYFTMAPAEFRETVLSWRRYVVRLLNGRLTLRERRDLYAVAGWLSGLLAEVSLALDEEAAPHCAVALALAQGIGDTRLAGWVRGTQAQIALYTGDPRQAVTYAQAGREVAPTGSAALVRACTQEARANARLGAHQDAQAALDAAEHSWNVMSQPTIRSIYSLSASYLPYCAATTFVWLSDSVNARRWGSQAVALVDSETQPTISTRVTARIDLAIAMVHSKELEAAVTVGAEAMDFWARRRAQPTRKRIQELLTALRPFPEPCVIDLKERWQWILD